MNTIYSKILLPKAIRSLTNWGWDTDAIILFKLTEINYVNKLNSELFNRGRGLGQSPSGGRGGGLGGGAPPDG